MKFLTLSNLMIFFSNVVRFIFFVFFYYAFNHFHIAIYTLVIQVRLTGVAELVDAVALGAVNYGFKSRCPLTGQLT